MIFIFITITTIAAMNSLHFENTALAELPVDPIENNTIRQVPNACFSRVKPSPVDNPKFIAVRLITFPIL